MNYYLDCEFLEGTQTKRILGIPYGNTKPTIDLISLALVAEDGRECYAISKDFNLKEAWNRFDIKASLTDERKAWKEYWIRENVLRPIFLELVGIDVQWYKDMWKRIPTYGSYHPKDHMFTYSNFKKLLNKYGKSNEQIAEEVKEFCGATFRYPDAIEDVDDNIIFYGYFCDYDWVVFCWLFGKMIDLPKGFPYYCRDLKQMLDEKVDELPISSIDGKIGVNVSSLTEYIGLGKTGIEIDSINDHPNYPKQTNEHSAIHDARWNRDLHKFIQSL